MEEARDKCRNVSEEEKNKKREYGKKQISQYVWKKKTKTKKYKNNYRQAKKSQYNNERNNFF